MKKITLILMSLAIGHIHAQAQNIPNGSFDNWEDISLGFYPDDYPQNSIIDDDEEGGTLSRVTDAQSGTYAAYLKTGIEPVNGDTNVAYILMGEFGDSVPSRGVPYTEKPDSFSGWFKYDVVAGDTAFALLIFWAEDSIITFDAYSFTGIQSTYAKFTFPITYMVDSVPDSMLIAFASSNIVNEIGVQPGSELYIDNISFIGAAQTIPNNDFENWTEAIYTDPINWKSGNRELIRTGITSASKTTDANSGSALRLEVVQSPWDTMGVNDIVCQSYESGDTSWNPIGFPYSVQPDSLTGWYKYIPNGLDTASIYIEFYKNDSSIGGIWYPLTSAGSYTRFSTPVWSLAGMPDTAFIQVSAGYNIGSILFLDDLLIIDTCISLPVVSLPADTAICPGVDSLTLDAGGGWESYLWSTGDTTQTITISDTGTYSVDASTSYGCYSLGSIIVTKAPCPGINTPSAPELHIYPNPNQGSFTLSINGLNGEDYTMRIFNIIGQMVYVEAINDLSGNITQQIDISNLPAGLYTIELNIGGQVLHEKVIVH